MGFRRRQAIAELLAEGRAPSEVARVLGIARNTVYYHLAILRREASEDAHAVGQSAPSARLPAQARWSATTRASVARLLESGLSRTEIAERLAISKATVSYHARRIGAPVDARCARRYDWKAVQEFYDAGYSIRETATAFGFSLQSWHAARLRGDLRARPAGLPLEELLVIDHPRSRANIKRRLLRAGLKQPRCERCCAEQWLDRTIPLDLHHVNGVRDDNRLENLKLLCPNCHAVTEGEGAKR